ncbi:MAG: NAD(P)/FAD-dependent oxidoreductase, partial [Chloroflexi bacterium]
MGLSQGRVRASAHAQAARPRTTPAAQLAARHRHRRAEYGARRRIDPPSTCRHRRRKDVVCGTLTRYLNDCVDRFELTSHLKLRTEIISLDWDANAHLWAVKARRRDGTDVTWTARIVVNATGALSRPSVPDIPGLDDFQGTVMHTARWQLEVKMANRRIGVVGTGASAIQVVPQLVDKAARVVL